MIVVLTAIVVVPWLLLVASSYLAFKFPVKQDRYGHAFLRHLPDRIAAYAYLLRSPWKLRNARMAIEEVDRIIEDVGARHGVHVTLIRAVVIYESAYMGNTVTTTGAMGLMALMPRTMKRLGVRDPFDPWANVDGGTRLLQALLRVFNGDVALALAAYNAGEPAVRRANGVPAYRESEDYVRYVQRLVEVCRLTRP